MRLRLLFLLLGALSLCACGEVKPPSQPPPVDCVPSPAAPIAQAGEDQTVRPGALVVLNGSGSQVAGAAARGFRWAFSSVPTGSRAELSNPAIVNPSFTADLPGSYVATLVVGDKCQESAPDSVTVVAAPPQNLRPVAHLGSSREVAVGVPVALDGSTSSDPEGDTLTFTWSVVSAPAGSAAVLAPPASAKPSFTPDLEGAYVVQLVVSDGKLESEPVLITLTGKNPVLIARPGASRTALSRKSVSLDGSASSGPSGSSLTFTWSFVSAPAGSVAVLSQPATAKPSFTPDLDGDYVIRLGVSDGKNESAPASLTVTAENRTPVANAGADRVVLLGSTVALQGQGSDENGDTLTFSWALTQKPAASTATLSGADTPTPSFVADLEGSYSLSLVVHDGFIASAADPVVLQSERPTVHVLGHRVIDAEYSKALDRLIMVSDNPNALYIYDPATRAETSVALPTTPTAVSVGPDGLFAVVGHDANISYIDLATPRRVKTLPMTTDAFDIVLAGNGYAYAFPRQDQWEEIHCVNLTTGAETLSGGWSIRAGTRARLHPNGTSMYGANNGLSPSDIEKYGITNGTAQMLYDSPYHGDYSMCGDLWFSEDGARIFTACGNTFRASDVRAEDMRYAGALSGAGFIRHLSHSTAADRIALVQGSSTPAVASQVRLYMPDFLGFDRSVQLPPYVRNNTPYTSHGRFVFFSSAGDKMIVVIQVDPSAAMLNDYGIITF